jgi:hypothetical protein
MTLLSDHFCRTMWLLSTSGQAVDPTEAAEQRALEMRLERTLAYVTGLASVRDFIPFPRGLKNRHQIAAA